MTTLRLFNTAVAALSIFLFASSTVEAAGHSKKDKKAASSQQQKSVDESASIRSQVKALEKSLGLADAAAVAAMWTTDGSYTNQDGDKWSGRQALQERFAGVFANEGRQLVELAPDNIKMVAPAVAIVEGVVRRRDFSSESPATRFNMVLVKQDGAWLISSASETPFVAQAQEEHLKDLSWLVGEWKLEKNGAYVHLNASWVATKKFLILSYQIKRPGQTQTVDSKQIIGWNPRTEKIVSWNFDANGGFGYGSWLKDGNRWTIEADGVDSDGSATRATNVIAMDGPDAFTWQSVDRSVDGVPFGDTPSLKIERAAK